jgi:hypothetical protein
MTTVTEKWASKCAEQAAKIERLRAALTKIAAIEDRYLGSDWEEIEEARGIAADALANSVTGKTT